ncbi:hypothetical protein ACFQ2T_06055 [Methylophilus flavus]|uniref:SDR family oxidoreductase n=1 Tax=Methylophilus flavus TaxID=640084 RepID=A0ABW3P9W0_9PROT
MLTNGVLHNREPIGYEPIESLGIVGVQDDIGPMITSLLSEDNRWVNAQRIEASGGMLI